MRYYSLQNTAVSKLLKLIKLFFLHFCENAKHWLCLSDVICCVTLKHFKLIVIFYKLYNSTFCCLLKINLHQITLLNFLTACIAFFFFFLNPIIKYQLGPIRACILRLRLNMCFILTKINDCLLYTHSWVEGGSGSD